MVHVTSLEGHSAHDMGIRMRTSLRLLSSLLLVPAYKMWVKTADKLSEKPLAQYKLFNCWTCYYFCEELHAVSILNNAIPNNARN